jgi:hypothetical protein
MHGAGEKTKATGGLLRHYYERIMKMNGAKNG